MLLCIRRGVEGVGREVQALMPRWVWKYVSPEIEIVNSDFQPGQGGKSFPGKRHWSFYDGKGRWKPFSKPNKVTRLQWEARVCQVNVFEPGPGGYSREANFNLFLISSVTCESLDSREFLRIFLKFHFSISISSHFYFTFTSRSQSQYRQICLFDYLSGCQENRLTIVSLRKIVLRLYL